MRDWSITCEDARDFLARLKARPAASRPKVLFSDPPYELEQGGRSKTANHVMMGGKFSKESYVNDGKICDVDLDWEDWAKPAFEALAPQAEAIIMCNDKHVGRAQRAFHAAGFRTHNILYWRKNDHGVSVVNRWMRKDTEYALYLFKGHARAVQKGFRHLGQGVSTPDFVPFWPILNSKTGEAKPHPNEKPVKLGLEWMGAITRPGETVIDPFCGSASFGVAASALGFDFLGCEKNADIAASARVRLAQTAETSTLDLMARFGGTASFDFAAPFYGASA